MATSTLTLQAATAASFDTGWTQTVGNTWTSTSLVLTVTGAGSIQLTVSLRDDDSTGEVYKQVVPWSASGTLTIPLPTPLYGQIRIKGDVVAAGGTVAVAISGDLGSVTSSDGTIYLPGPVRGASPGLMIQSRGSALWRVGYPKAGTAMSAARTYDEQIPVFGDFTGLKVGVSDAMRATSDRIDLVAVASPAVNNSNGSNLTWTPVYFDGKRQITRTGMAPSSTSVYQAIAPEGVVLGQRYFIAYFMPANVVIRANTTTLTPLVDYYYNPDDGTVRFISGGAVSAGATNLNWTIVGSTGGADVPKTIWSDHVNLLSNARTDLVGGFPLLRCRTYVRGDLGNGGWYALNPTNNSTDVGTWFGEPGASWDNYTTGDAITTPGAVTVTTSGSRWQCGQFLIDYVLPCYDIGIYGDSIANGASTIDSMSPANWAAKFAYKNGKYVLSNYNAAVASRVMKNMAAALKQDLEMYGLRPTFAILQAGSGNNGDSTSIPQTFTYLSQMLDLCRKYGVIPIIETLQPHVVWNTPDPTTRHTYNAIIRSMAGERALVLDSDMIVRDPSNIDAILPAYAVGVTEPHINVAGEQAKGLALYQMVDRLLR